MNRIRNVSGHPDPLVLCVFYEGPWERLATRLLAIDPITLEQRREIRDGTLRERLATWASERDTRWRHRYVERGIDPPARWKRKPRGER